METLVHDFNEEKVTIKGGMEILTINNKNKGIYFISKTRIVGILTKNEDKKTNETKYRIAISLPQFETSLKLVSFGF